MGGFWFARLYVDSGLGVILSCAGPSLLKELDLRICKRGYLWKTGGDRTGWKKRFCTLDSDSFKYFKDDSVSCAIVVCVMCLVVWCVCVVWCGVV